jgi:hypothetical protein
MGLKRTRFATVEHIKSIAMAELRMILKNFPLLLPTMAG